MNINQLPAPLSSGKQVYPRVMVTILRGGVQSFFGNIIRETTSGYVVIWDKDEGIAHNPLGEWFSKSSPLVTCKMM